MCNASIVFVSFGMFIIDTIIDLNGARRDDVIGGAGTFAAVGSRMFSAPRETGFVIDYGNDVPPSVESTIAGLNLALHVRRDTKRQCTRGLNTYVGALRQFSYLTPKIRITASHLPETFLAARSFHLICTPERCLDLLRELRTLRAQHGIQGTFISVWEPVPDCCVPENKPAFMQAVQVVDIVSPNMDESAALLGRQLDQRNNKACVQEMSQEWRDMGAINVVIRCSANGAYLASAALAKWYPALITNASQVVDATGAGNAFCGALATTLALGKSMDEAMCCAAVGAGLCILQVGLPKFDTKHGKELWNGDDIEYWKEQYRVRSKQV